MENKLAGQFQAVLQGVFSVFLYIFGIQYFCQKRSDKKEFAR